MNERNLLGRVLDLVTYAVAGAALAFVVTGVVSFVAGYGVTGIKWGLFYVGWLVFGYAAIRLFPASLHEDQSLPGEDPKSSAWLTFGGQAAEDAPIKRSSKEAEKTFASTDETPFQRLVQRLPPARFVPIRKAERFPVGVKTLALSLAILGTSLAMEVVFQVA